LIDSKQAVFLSYASEDAAAAARLCASLRAAGIEVWFDQSELRGGDSWDQMIRQRIHDCALFIPVISTNTEGRREGYFRREWRLAIDRTHDMSDRVPFLLPVVIDDTDEKGADVPEQFLRVQWTRLPGGTVPAVFCDRTKALLSGTNRPTWPQAGTRPVSPLLPKGKARGRLFAAGAVLVAAALGWQAWRLKTPALAPRVAAPTATFAPPPHSIAVLPFVNMSGDKEQEYFSEGLTEELLNSLTRLNELQVAARTSSFSFQGEHPDIVTVAHKLNVGAVLEGSVRRSEHTVRISAQLVNGVTGFQIWSRTYDRSLGDVLQLQTEIANAVANALKVTLLGDVTAKIDLGGTRNPAAFDAHLRASKAYIDGQTENELQAAIAGFTESIRLDPNYALAYADRSFALAAFAVDWAKEPAVRADYGNRARADARKAIELAPDLAEGHLALAGQLTDALEFKSANQQFARALELAPGSARVLRNYALFAAEMGQVEPGLAAARRSVLLDPLNPSAHSALGFALLIAARRYGEAIVVLKNAKVLAPHDGWINAWLGYAYYRLGNLPNAQSACEEEPVGFLNGFCLALVYEKLGHHANAQSMLANMRAAWGDDGAVFYAMIYSEWGDDARALDSLDVAMRHRSAYLTFVKTEFDSLRALARFQAITRELDFPD
jgi:TolB-like protein/tetratricopeptide (TPR) repeat protein